ncbi:hypothetical protein BaRGS_00031478 [Batillaria attramentaria]|uniref:EF-hand domain-containing protein n=1 Tax=Batillaria attramentaria TaxID=370345 RepID=A0ABD0JQG9_9CAEN
MHLPVIAPILLSVSLLGCSEGGWWSNMWHSVGEGVEKAVDWVAEEGWEVIELGAEFAEAVEPFVGKREPVSTPRKEAMLAALNQACPEFDVGDDAPLSMVVAKTFQRVDENKDGLLDEAEGEMFDKVIIWAYRQATSLGLQAGYKSGPTGRLQVWAYRQATSCQNIARDSLLSSSRMAIERRMFEICMERSMRPATLALLLIVCLAVFVGTEALWKSTAWRRVKDTAKKTKEKVKGTVKKAGEWVKKNCEGGFPQLVSCKLSGRRREVGASDDVLLAALDHACPDFDVGPDADLSDIVTHAFQQADGHYDDILLTGHYDDILLTGHYDDILLTGHYDDILLTGHYDDILLTGHYDELLLTGHYDYILLTGHYDYILLTGHYDYTAYSNNKPLPIVHNERSRTSYYTNLVVYYDK